MGDRIAARRRLGIEMGLEMKGSRPDLHIKKVIVDALGVQPGVRLAILFGSLAGGEGRFESDLDLAVDAGHPLSAGEKIALILALAERTGRPVDLVDIHDVGEPLLGEILRHGKRVLGSDTDYAKMIRRHLFDQADFLPYRNRILAERRRAWIGT